MRGLVEEKKRANNRSSVSKKTLHYFRGCHHNTVQGALKLGRGKIEIGRIRWGKEGAERGNLEIGGIERGNRETVTTERGNSEVGRGVRKIWSGNIGIERWNKHGNKAETWELRLETESLNSGVWRGSIEPRSRKENNGDWKAAWTLGEWTMEHGETAWELGGSTTKCGESVWELGEWTMKWDRTA